MNLIWTWIITLRKNWTVVELWQSFKKSGLDLDRHIWHSAHLWFGIPPL